VCAERKHRGGIAGVGEKLTVKESAGRVRVVLQDTFGRGGLDQFKKKLAKRSFGGLGPFGMNNSLFISLFSSKLMLHDCDHLCSLQDGWLCTRLYFFFFLEIKKRKKKKMFQIFF